MRGAPPVMIGVVNMGITSTPTRLEFCHFRRDHVTSNGSYCSPPAVVVAKNNIIIIRRSRCLHPALVPMGPPPRPAMASAECCCGILAPPVFGTKSGRQVGPFNGLPPRVKRRPGLLTLVFHTAEVLIIVVRGWGGVGPVHHDNTQRGIGGCSTGRPSEPGAYTGKPSTPAYICLTSGETPC